MTGVRKKPTIKKLALSLLVGLAVSSLSAVPTFAGPSGMDYFANTTPQNSLPQSAKQQAPAQKPINNVSLSPLATMSARTPEVTWFETTDDIIAKYQPSDIDRVVLNRLINDTDRLDQWTKTAMKVSKNYKFLAKELRTTKVPRNNPELKEYIAAVADWYSDSAGIYDELVRPRPPAKTIEELKEGLTELEERAKALGETNKTLHDMDTNLRKEYKVHLARATDPIWQFAHGGK